jgi:hypothetical protein
MEQTNSVITDRRPKFWTGLLCVTTPADQKIEQKEIHAAFCRHESGDWGDACDEDREANERALEYGGRLFSAYYDSKGVKFWIITEADRSATTVLLPDDY